MSHTRDHIIIQLKEWVAKPSSLKNGYWLGIGAACFIAGAWIF